MRAVVYTGYGATPALAEVLEPACPDEGVVIAVGATGVCRSDWHAWRGHDPVPLPHIGGHELAGVYVALRENWSDVCAHDEVWPLQTFKVVQFLKIVRTVACLNEK